MSEPELRAATAASHRHLQVVGPAFAEPLPVADPYPWRTRLSRREADVLLLLADGLSTVEIARALFISPATVKCHVARLIAKVGARDRVQLVIAAYRSGFVRVD